MDAKLVREKLIKVLTQIQTASGLVCPTLTGSIRPIGDLDKFDSKVWPVAIGMLGIEIGITIPDAVNIFKKEKSDTCLTIDEAVEVVIKLAQEQEQTPNIPVNTK